MNRGFVVGKFYPLHAGHSYLIDTALRQVDELTVAVCDTPGQRIPAATREQWIRELHPKARTMIVPDIMNDDDSKAWADYTKQFLGYAPDFVFTSEDYGEPYAMYMGSKHVMVDRHRKKVPISATKVKENPYRSWQYLAPPVRAYFTKRICVLGAESSGTTTMAQSLAKHYRTIWVPEFGRWYAEAKLFASAHYHWTSDEFVYIAQQQNKVEDVLAKQSQGLLICDTDSFATRLWHERYMGFISPDVDAISAGRNHDLYLLTDVDIPFVQDGTRDGERIRHAMHKRFMEELTKRSKPF